MDVGDVAAEATDRHNALQALASLPEADRELLPLIAWHGLGARGAEQLLDSTTATLTVPPNRARRQREKPVETAPVSQTASAPPVEAPHLTHHEGAPA